MSAFVAALPMYDWPETRAEIDAEWAALRDALRTCGVDAPERLTRPGGDLPALWRHPQLLLAQTCWGPMQAGLQGHVKLLGQPDYSAYEGGRGALYSSAILMRKSDAGDVDAPLDGCAILPLDGLRGARFAYNAPDSMSGMLAPERDLQAAGEGVSIFAGMLETGSHRTSALAVAEGRADACALDCRTWAMFRRFEPDAAADLRVAGWTAHRNGLPFITGGTTPAETVQTLRRILADQKRILRAAVRAL